MHRKITRTSGARFTTLELTLEDGRLSICGSYGRIISKPKAKREALDYWRSFFEEEPNQIFEMNKRCGSNCRTPGGAARYVLEHDGALHGLDVTQATDSAVYIGEGFGQCIDEISAAFPEVVPFLEWHQNYRKAGCEHQAALGWGHGRDVALSKDDLTEPQRTALMTVREAQVTREREQEHAKMIEIFRTNRSALFDYYRAHYHRAPTIHETEIWEGTNQWFAMPQRKQLLAELDAHIAKRFPVEIASQVFKDSLGAPCPTCGYRYGTAWLKRELPPEVVAWVTKACETGILTAA